MTSLLQAAREVTAHRDVTPSLFVTIGKLRMAVGVEEARILTASALASIDRGNGVGSGLPPLVGDSASNPTRMPATSSVPARDGSFDEGPAKQKSSDLPATSRDVAKRGIAESVVFGGGR